MKYLWLVPAAVLTAFAGLSPPAAPTQQPDNNAQGVEVLTSGPVHEAFAQPTEIRPQASPVVPKQPPGPIEEVPPDQKQAGDNVVWIPGYWAWEDERSDFI